MLHHEPSKDVRLLSQSSKAEKWPRKILSVTFSYLFLCVSCITWPSRMFRCTLNFIHTFKRCFKKMVENLSFFFFSHLILIIEGCSLVGSASEAGTIVFTVDERNT